MVLITSGFHSHSSTDSKWFSAVNWTELSFRFQVFSNGSWGKWSEGWKKKIRGEGSIQSNQVYWKHELNFEKKLPLIKFWCTGAKTTHRFMCRNIQPNQTWASIRAAHLQAVRQLRSIQSCSHSCVFFGLPFSLLYWYQLHNSIHYKGL